MSKFDGKITDFTIMQLVIAKTYPGWMLECRSKLGKPVYVLIAHGEALYVMDTLDLVGQLVNIDLAVEKKLRNTHQGE